jgi:hypothetical protein
MEAFFHFHHRSIIRNVQVKRIDIPILKLNLSFCIQPITLLYLIIFMVSFVKFEYHVTTMTYV